MQIFIALNTNFLTFEPDARKWIVEFSDALKHQGIECVLFDGNSTLLPPKAIVHFFSTFDSETWKVLKETGRVVVVTPTLDGKILSAKRDRILTYIDIILRRVMGISSLLVESEFRKSGRHFLVTCADVSDELNHCWGITESKITIFGFDPKNAAVVASRLYNQLSSE